MFTDAGTISSLLKLNLVLDQQVCDSVFRFMDNLAALEAVTRVIPNTLTKPWKELTCL